MAAAADTDTTRLDPTQLVTPPGFERLPEGQPCANGTTLTTVEECQAAFKFLKSTLPAGCKDYTKCCNGTNLPYGCSYRIDNDLVNPLRDKWLGLFLFTFAA